MSPNIGGRVHKERKQLQWRESVGNLEKKTDYKKRSAAAKKQRTIVRKAQRAAAQRNPDEFSFKMASSTTDDYGRIVRSERYPNQGEQLASLSKSLLGLQRRRTLYKKRLDRLKSSAVSAVSAAGAAQQPAPRLSRRLLLADEEELPALAAAAARSTIVASSASALLPAGAPQSVRMRRANRREQEDPAPSVDAVDVSAALKQHADAIAAYENRIEEIDTLLRRGETHRTNLSSERRINVVLNGESKTPIRMQCRKR